MRIIILLTALLVLILLLNHQNIVELENRNKDLNLRLDTLERRIELTQQHYLDCAFITTEMVEVKKGKLRIK